MLLPYCKDNYKADIVYIDNLLGNVKDENMKAVCIDDEKLALDFMTHLLNKVDNVEVIGTFLQAKEGLAFILAETVDVVFLDIHMPEINGLQLAEKILEKKPHVDIVFVTAYNEYAVSAFDLNAIDYLMKPVKIDRLKKTIDRLEKEQALKPAVEEKQNKLHIRLGNSVSFALEDAPFEPLKWRTAKARELFLYLLQNNDTFVHKGSLMEQLWGEDELDRGYSILYTTVYNVRKALQTYAKHIELKNTNDGYMLNLNHVEVDLHEWEKRVKNLPDEVNDDSIDDYISAMAFNSGPYLADYDYIWIEAEKQNLENLWLVTAKEIAEYYFDKKEMSDAIHWFEKIVQRIPELEEAHLALMNIYAETRQHHLVEQQYADYVTIQKSYDLRPGPKVRKWYTDYIETI